MSYPTKKFEQIAFEAYVSALSFRKWPEQRHLDELVRDINRLAVEHRKAFNVPKMRSDKRARLLLWVNATLRELHTILPTLPGAIA